MESNIFTLDSSRSNVKDALSDLLSENHVISGKETNPEELRRQLKEKKPDVIVMELSGGKEEGLSLIGEITECDLNEKKPSFIIIRNLMNSNPEIKRAQPDPDELIMEKLLLLGIPASIKGYTYLRTAISCAIENRDILNNLTQNLYPFVAEVCGATASRVERDIRHAISVSCDRADEDVLQDFFSYSTNGRRGRPTNLEFIALVTDKIAFEIKNTLSNNA